MKAKQIERKTEIVEGLVESCTDTGLLVGGTWYSKSKYRTVPDLEKIGTGDTIKLMVDGKGFIERAKVLKEGF